MKILITGQNGYIGKNLDFRLSLKNPEWLVERVSIRNGIPSLQAVDVVVHAAALVHTDAKSTDDFDRINRELTLELAKEAEKSQIGHFIFLSTMAVYGAEAFLDKPTVIDAFTPCRPVTPYGQSKLSAEEGLRAANLNKLSIIRPPMVYGPECPGNYAKLVALAKKTPVFPYWENQRSVLHIDNLCELIRLIILHQQEGIICPQDEQYMNTARTLEELGKSFNNRIYLSKAMGRLIMVSPLKITRKIFGSLVYAKELSAFPYNYHI